MTQEQKTSGLAISRFEKANRETVKTVLLTVVAAIAGFGCIIVPYLVEHGYDASKLMPAPLFPLISTAWKALSFKSIILLGFTGLILGALRPRYWWLLGLATMSIMPIAAALEMIKLPTSHNLWPIEFLIYGFVNTPAFLGSFVGSRARNWTEKKKHQCSPPPPRARGGHSEGE